MLPLTHRLAFSIVAAIGALHTASVARGEPTSWSCGLVEDNTIHLDGLTSDWDGVSPYVLKVNPQPGAPERTLGVKLSCNYDEKNIYLLINVDDDVVLRSSGAPSGEDHIELHFGVPEKKGGALRVDKLFIYPGSVPQKQKRVVKWQAPKAPKVVEGEGPAGRKKGSAGAAFEIYDALQPRGYAVEMRMPKKLVPGYKDGAPLRLSVRVVDSDSPNGKLAASAELSPGDSPDELAVLEIEGGGASLDEMLGDLKQTSSDVFFDKNADLGDGPGRVLMIGKFIAFSGKAYAYQEVAPSRADIKSAQLIDLDAKHQALALRIVERGSGGARELLRIYTLSGGRFASIFSAEVTKEQGGRRLASQVSFDRRGQSTDITLTPQPAVGFSAATYNELPAEDVVPILLPWQDKRARYLYKAQKFTKE
jgi:hypothetical protein